MELASVEHPHALLLVVGAVGGVKRNLGRFVFLVGDLELDLKVGELRPLIECPLVLNLLDLLGVGVENGTHDAFPLGLVIGTGGRLFVDGRCFPHFLNLCGSGGKSGNGSGGNEKLHLNLFVIIIQFD